MVIKYGKADELGNKFPFGNRFPNLINILALKEKILNFGIYNLYFYIIMVDFTRKQLDELLGKDRNEVRQLKENEFTDPSYCRLFLAGILILSNYYQLFMYI